MANLLFYHTEKLVYAKAYAVNLDTKQSYKIFVKLVRHFKLLNPDSFLHRELQLQFYRGRGGLFYSSSWRVKLNKSSNLGILCHEVSHALDSLKRRTRHDKRMFRLMGRVIKYCESNVSIREIVSKP